jgi:hypothetical protein
MKEYTFQLFFNGVICLLNNGLLDKQDTPFSMLPKGYEI